MASRQKNLMHPSEKRSLCYKTRGVTGSYTTWKLPVGFPRILRAVMLFLSMMPSAFAQNKDLVPPRVYEANFTDETLEIDGRADEEAWSKAPFSQAFIDIEGEASPRYATRMKMLWGEHYLYFYAEMEEPQVWATLKQRDTVIFYNNDFEIFIDPDGDTHQYYEFEMNALNTVWDLLLVKPYRNGGSVLDHWDINGLLSAVHVEGTLNRPGDTDKGWSVEVAMPWDVLREASGTPVPPGGTFWRINFSRVNWDHDLKEGRYSRKKDSQGQYLPEYNWVWSPQQVVNMHEPERWGYVYFRPGDSREDFTIPETEQIKWELYARYRQLISGEGSLLEQIRENRTIPAPISFKGEELEVFLEFHSAGWNLGCRLPGDEGLMLIREDGRFMIKSK